MDPDIFFPISKNDVDIPMALMTCKGCPVRQECLDYAIAFPALEGIWAGTQRRERDAIRRRRRKMAQRNLG